MPPDPTKQKNLPAAVARRSAAVSRFNGFHVLPLSRLTAAAPFRPMATSVPSCAAGHGPKLLMAGAGNGLPRLAAILAAENLTAVAHGHRDLRTMRRNAPQAAFALAAVGGLPSLSTVPAQQDAAAAVRV